MCMMKNRNYSRYSQGKVPSIKMNRMIHFTNLYELDLIYLLEYMPNVKEYTKYPFSIVYSFEGLNYSYTPSFQIIGDDFIVLCEFLVTDSPNNVRQERDFKFAKTWCEERNWRFQIIKWQDLKQGSLLENVKYLTRFSRGIVNPDLHARIVTTLLEYAEPIKIINILALIPQCSRELIYPALFHMAYHHEIYINVSEASISPLTQVSLSLQRS